MGTLELLVVVYAALFFVLAIIVFGVPGRRADEHEKRLQSIEGSISQAKNQMELSGTFFSRIMLPLFGKISAFLSGLFPKQKSGGKSRTTSELERKLRLAGLYIQPQEFSMLKGLTMIVCLVLSAVLAFFSDVALSNKLFIVLLGLMFGLILPTLFLRMKIVNHQSGIRDQLPDAMDLLGVCLEAGLSFDSSLQKVSEQMKGPFIDEMLIMYREIQMGATRKDALIHLAENNQVEELKTFASALSQAEQLGLPVNNVMKIQSKQLRMTRREKAKEKGMKASIKMLVPVLIFVFPALFIILMGPTVMNIMSVLGGG